MTFGKEQNLGYQEHANAVQVVLDHGAHEWSLRPGQKQHGEAAFKLGNRHFVAKDATKAIRWYLRAADAGHTGAQYNLGLMYLKGEGVSRNTLKGLGWVTKAAECGDEKARELLQRIDQTLVGR